MSYDILTRDEHYQYPGPKRILTVDGGGLRGIFSLALLKRIEDILQARHGDGFRLSHYFDLIAGTSTGSVIASSLALGMSVDEVIDAYEALGRNVFKKSLLRQGLIRAKYDKDTIAAALDDTFGTEDGSDDPVTMGSERIQTGLLIMTKRRDTGSPWPIGNNPQGQYYFTDPEENNIANKDYPLSKVVRASTAAPAFFDGETIEVATAEGKQPVVGEFVDGGVSPFNNPSLQAFMYATLRGFRVQWPMGKDNILLVSVGTGSRDPAVQGKFLEAHNAVRSLVSMMDDCNALVQTMLQWMSGGPTFHTIDAEIGDLSGDLLGQEPLLSYMRYNMELSDKGLREELGKELDKDTLDRLAKMDVPDNMPILKEIGTEAAEKFIDDAHFPAHFDLGDGANANQVA